MSKLTHLAAFLSDDAKKGREWQCGNMQYRRADDNLEFWNAMTGHYETWRAQVASMPGDCRWADEPKTLTPQDALRALADGKTISPAGEGTKPIRLNAAGFFEYESEDGDTAACPMYHCNGWRIVTDGEKGGGR